NMMNASKFVAEISKSDNIFINREFLTSSIEIKDIKLSATHISINDCRFGELEFNEVDLHFGIKFENCHFKKLSFINRRASNFDITDRLTNYHLEFQNGQIAEIYITSRTDNKRGIILSHKSSVSKLHVINYSSSGSFILENSTVNDTIDLKGCNIKGSV